MALVFSLWYYYQDHDKSLVDITVKVGTYDHLAWLGLSGTLS